MTGACSSTTDGTPTAPSTTDKHAATAALWDPCTIPHEVWRQIGVDPSTLSNDMGGGAGVALPDGFKRCGGHNNPWTVSVDVWSQIYGVDDFKRKEAGAQFTDVTVAGRSGVRYQPAGDKTGDHCNIVFPSSAGSFSIEVMRADPSSTVNPCDHAMHVPGTVVPLIPN